MTMMPKYLKAVLWQLAIVQSLFWILIVWFSVRPDGLVFLAFMGLSFLAAISWACLAVTLFFPSARPWRLKLIGLAVPAIAFLFAGFGYMLRPVAFYLARPAFESVVAEL